MADRLIHHKYSSRGRKHVTPAMNPARIGRYYCATIVADVEDGSEEAHRLEQSLTESTPGNYTLLLVEDDKLVQNVAIRVLERAGYAVEHASSLREAKERLSGGFVPDLLITDVMLPDGNGRELADAIAESAPNAPVLFISGYPDDVISEFGIDGPTITFLQKPFTPAQLRECVADLLESAG